MGAFFETRPIFLGSSYAIAFLVSLLPIEPKVKAYGQVVARSALVTHAIIGASWAKSSIAKLGLGEMSGSEVPWAFGRKM